jgi:hypothetical protein
MANLIDLSGQIRTTWIGGTPGRETDWYCAKNWSKNQVPNEFSVVTIPDVSTTTFVYPKIKKGEAIVFSLDIQPGAKLGLDDSAILVILDHLSKIDTICIANAGKIVFRETSLNH